MKSYQQFITENEYLLESPASMVLDIIGANSVKPLIAKIEKGSVDDIAKEISNMPFKSKEKVWKQIRSFIRLQKNPSIRKKLEDVWHKSHDYNDTHTAGIKYHH